MSNAEQKNVMYRSLDELEDSPEFKDFLAREFPPGAEDAPDGFTRRRWMQLMGASAVLAGVSGCRFENRKITPYSFRPEDRVPGETRTFATTIEWAGSVRPLFVTSFDARPIKADGSAIHPLTSSYKGGHGDAPAKGASDAVTQACVLDLYDPDRSRGCLEKVERDFVERSWDDFTGALGSLHLTGDGSGVVVISEPSTSRSVAALKKKLLAKMPQAKWFEYAPVNNDNELAGLKAAFGKSVRPQYSLDKAEVVVCLDADPLANHPDSLRLVREFAESRVPGNAVKDHRRISRLYSVESQFSLTGVNADHRWPVKSSKIKSFAQDLLAHIQKIRETEKPLPLTGSAVEDRLVILAKQLVFGASGKGVSGGRCVVMAGSQQSPEVHQLVAVINHAIGSTLVKYAAVEEGGSSLSEIAAAVKALESGSVETALIIGGNPVFDAPGDLGFEAALEKAHHSIHFSIAKNETTDRCGWHLNQAHPLEVWSDSVAFDGSRCVGQPMIEPMFGAKSTAELLSILLGDNKGGMELAREAFADLDESGWKKLVHDGFVEGSAASTVSVGEPKSIELSDQTSWRAEDDEDLELVFTPSRLYDGRLANNGWLQEVPDPVTKVTWDNPAIMSPATAKRINARQNEKVKIEVNGQSIEAPVFIQPGQAENSIGIAIGYGRKKVGYIGGSIEKNIEPVGIDVGPVRQTSGWLIATCKAAGTGARYRLSSTQDHHAIDLTGKQEIGRRYSSLIFEGTFDSFEHFAEEHHLGEDNDEPKGHEKGDDGKHDSDADHKKDEHAKGGDDHGHHAAWPGYKHLHFENVDPIPRSYDYSDELKWGMTIDLTKCVGCSACVVACQAENNIAVVGKDQVSRGRELHWLRIDRYLSANESFAKAGKILDDPEPRVRTQPVACHHCENAPCEQVCPVAATVHSTEGLNDMVYNRCIGTRYCGNNCPYKVRRFNYLNYSDATTFVKYPWADKLSQDDLGIRGLANNPEVTVRSRGVMEKCTYCVQRIQNVRIKAKAEGRSIGSNEITTACQDVCGAQAIKFGNLADPDSDVAKASADVRSYVMLEELNIGQRTRYLAKVTNPNKDWPVFVYDESNPKAFKPYSEVFKEKGHHGANGHSGSDTPKGKSEEKDHEKENEKSKA